MLKKEEFSYSEARIQQDIVMWYKNSYCLVHHIPRSLILSIPNEGKPFLTQTGLMAGSADLMVIDRYTAPGVLNGGIICIVLFVEVKTPNKKQSAKQLKFQSHVESMGFSYHIVRSLEEFTKMISHGRK